MTTVVANSQPSFAQESPDAGSRKVVTRVTPQYPTWARSMNLKGIVKVEAVVEGNGTVKTVELKGGHPVLAQSAMNAVRQWKWEPASHESREYIEVRFDPQ
ncbi:MAG: energy transducer TonB [Terriglobales bacterium]